MYGVPHNTRLCMKILLFATAFAMVSCAGAAQANTLIPYSNAGIVNTQSLTFTATGGPIDAYFYGSSAADTDLLGIEVNGGLVGTGGSLGFGLSNQTAVGGQVFDLGTAPAGATITFVLENQSTSVDLYSTPSLNSDKLQHVYETAFSSAGSYAAYNIPSGIYLGFEDLTSSQGSDFDYNDEQIVITGVSVTPLPAALPLFAGGLGLLGLFARRKKQGAIDAFAT
jgi:hypothetical protein